MNGIVNVYDEATGKYISIPAIKGKSAYQYAVDGGYTGTEAEFYAIMADAETKTNVADRFGGERTAEGKLITISDQVEKPKFKSLTLYGQSTQKTTSGKNLLDINNITQINGATASVDGDVIKITNGVYVESGYVNVWAPIALSSFKGKTVYFRSDNLSVTSGFTLRLRIRYRVIGSDSNVIIQGNPHGSFVVPEDIDDTQTYFCADISGTKENASVQATITRPYITLDSSASYEPYTGGIPSPNPSYPQTISSIGDNGSVSQKVCGKNLIPWPYVYNSYTTKGVTYTVNDDGTVRITGTSTSSHSFILESGDLSKYSGMILSGGVNDKCRFILQAGPPSYKTYALSSGNSAVISQIPEGTECNLYIATDSGITFNDVVKPMIEYGSEATSYEPYQATTTSLTTAIPLCGIPVSSGEGNVTIDGQEYIADTLEVFEDGSGQVVKRCNAIDINDIPFGDFITYQNGTVCRVTAWNKLAGASNPDTNVLPLCTSFTSILYTDRTSNTSFVSLASNDTNSIGSVLVQFDATYGLTSMEDTLAYMSTIDMQMIYALATPKNIPLTPSEVQSILNSELYAPVTNFYNDAGAYQKVVYTSNQIARNEYLQEDIDELETHLGTEGNKLSGSFIQIPGENDPVITGVKLFGQSTQKTTSGKNLIPWPYSYASRTEYGVTFTINADGSVTVKTDAGGATARTNLLLLGSGGDGTHSIPNGSYILSGAPSTGSATTYWMQFWHPQGDTGTVVNTGGDSAVTFTNASSSYNVAICVAAGTVLTTPVTFHPMLRLSTVTDSTYEPPTNGPSPNPSYPQAIINKGDSGAIGLTACGKNLLPKFESTTHIGVTFSAEEDGTVIANGTNTHASLHSQLYGEIFYLPAGTYTVSGAPDGSSIANNDMYVYDVTNDVSIGRSYTGTTMSTFTIDSGRLIRVMCRVTSGATVSNVVFKPQLEAGIKPTSYEPHQATSATIESALPLCGIPVSSGGNVMIDGQEYIADTLEVFEDGSGQVTEHIGVYTFNGNEDVSMVPETIGTNSERFNVSLNLGAKNDAMLCTHLVRGTAGGDRISGQIWMYNGEAHYNRFRIWRPFLSGTVTGDATSANLKAWLKTLYNAGSPIRLYYVHAEPVVTSLTPSEVQSILATQTYKPLTNVYNDAGAHQEVYYATGMKGVHAALKKENSILEQEILKRNQDSYYVHMLHNRPYKEVMAAWFKANGSEYKNDLTELCERWYTITRMSWRGGTTFNQPSKSSVSTGTKTGNNADLVVEPSTNTVAGRDDYANLPLFAPVDCNAWLDSDGEPHISAIDGITSRNAFTRYDSNKIVGVLQQTGWVKYSETADEYSYEYTDIPELDGFKPLPEAVRLKDNTVRPFVVHAKYGLDDTWGSFSGQPMRAWDVSHNACLTNIRSKRGNRYCGKTSADDAFVKIMCYIKYGSLTLEPKMMGCVSYSLQYTVSVAESNVSRVLVTTAQGTNFIVGSNVIVGDATTNTNLDRTHAYMRNKVNRATIKSKTEVTVNGTAYTALNLDCAAFSITAPATTYVSTIPWDTGVTDNVLGNDGSPYSNTSQKEPYKIQGIEMMYGIYEVLGDTIWKYYKDSSSVCRVSANVCRNATKLSTSVTSDYKTTSYSVATPASNLWNYIRKLGHDSALTEAMFPVDVTGGSSSTLTRDGVYLLANSTSAYELLSLGNLIIGGHAGLSCLLGSSGLSSTYWSIGGRLSLTGNRGEYAV